MVIGLVYILSKGVPFMSPLYKKAYDVHHICHGGIDIHFTAPMHMDG